MNNQPDYRYAREPRGQNAIGHQNTAVKHNANYGITVKRIIQRLSYQPVIERRLLQIEA
jgi:hypothetical protein